MLLRTSSTYRNTRCPRFSSFIFISLVTLTMLLFLCIANVYSAQVTLAWDPPENEQDIVGYKVHYGNSSGNYDTSIDAGNQTSYTITGLESGKIYYFVVTSYNIYGYESSYSIELIYAIPTNEIIIDNGDPGTSSSFDDFSTDTTGNYTVTNTWTDGAFGSFLYDSAGQRAQVLTGDNVGLQFSHSLSPIDTGTFSIDFLPTAKYPSGGYFILFLRQDANNYYLLRNTDGYGPGIIRKYVGGVIVDSANFSIGYSQNNYYSITIDFSPGQTTVNAFGETLTINTDSSSIMVNSYEIDTHQQDAYFDNISYTD